MLETYTVVTAWAFRSEGSSLSTSRLQELAPQMVITKVQGVCLLLAWEIWGFAFLSQEDLSLKMEFNVAFNSKVSHGWLCFSNSYEKGLSLSLDRTADEQWSKHKGGHFSCLRDWDGSDCNKDPENMSYALLQGRQAGLLSLEREHYLESELWHWIVSNHHSSPAPEHQVPCWCFICTSLSVSTAPTQLCFTCWPPANWVPSALVWLQLTPDLLWCLFIFLSQTFSARFTFEGLCFTGIWKCLCGHLQCWSSKYHSYSPLQQSLLTLSFFSGLKSKSHLRDVSCWEAFLFYFSIAST